MLDRSHDANKMRLASTTELSVELDQLARDAPFTYVNVPLVPLNQVVTPGLLSGNRHYF